MSEANTNPEQSIFEGDSWSELSSIFSHLPEPVMLTVWGDGDGSHGERQAAHLCQTLADNFDTIQFRLLPRRVNYPYYPVIGVMGYQEEEEVDFGVRIIGLPAGYQMTSLITAIQAVSFRGATVEPGTRIKMHKLAADVTLELMSAADNEGGPLVAKIIFGLAVINPHVRSYLIMSDRFPEANLRYSVNIIPHLVINGRVHLEGVVDEDAVVRHIAKAVT